MFLSTDIQWILSMTENLAIGGHEKSYYSLLRAIHGALVNDSTDAFEIGRNALSAISCHGDHCERFQVSTRPMLQ